MPLLMLKDLPRYECLLAAAQQFPDLDPSATEAYLHLLRTSDEAFRVITTNLNQNGLSQGRFTVLMLLLDKGTGRPCASTPAELADKAGVTRATMTGLVDTLERDGMVTRQPDPEDRRMMSVALTDKGVAFIKEVLPGHFRRMAALMGSLSESERQILVRLLTKILTQADTVEPPHRSDTEGTFPVHV
ncbi:MAG: MarR family transcriptional regulator [Verrucomicrobia bacterium]|nr:MarR family transcriptional regulator [Verrucomicrobiota bacterium]